VKAAVADQEISKLLLVDDIVAEEASPNKKTIIMSEKSLSKRSWRKGNLQREVAGSNTDLKLGQVLLTDEARRHCGGGGFVVVD
jgi:hypothetical protein